MRNLIIIIALSASVFGYSQEEFKNSRDSLSAIGYPNGQLFNLFPNEGGNFTFIHEGKMGLANIMFEKAQVLIPPTYDLIFNERFAIKNGTIYYLKRHNQGNWNEYVISKELQARKSLRLDYDLAGVVTYTVDGKYYEIVYNGEDDTMRLKQQKEIRIHPEFSYEIEKLDQQLYRILKHDREEIDLYDEYGDILKTAYEGEDVTGIFDLKSRKWKIPPIATDVRKVENGFMLLKEKETDMYETISSYGYFSDSIHFLEYSDSIQEKLLVPFLPKDAQVLTQNDDHTWIIKKNNKVGLFYMSLFEMKAETFVKPLHDFAAYCSDLDLILTINKGRIELKKTNLNTTSKEINLSSIPSKIIKSFILYQNEVDYYEEPAHIISINGKVYGIDEKGNLELKKTQTISFGNWIPQYELYLQPNNKVILSVNNLRKEPIWDEWGEQMFDENGDYAYTISGWRFGGVFNPQTKSFEEIHSRVAPLTKGLVFEKDERSGDKISSKSSYIYNEKKFNADSFQEENGLIQFTKNGETGIMNSEQIILVQPKDYSSSIIIKDGILFSPQQEIINEWGEYDYDENGNLIMSPEILITSRGDTVKTGYYNKELLNNQLMIAQDSNSKFILYDLKNKKPLAGPLEAHNFDLPQPLGNIRWIQKDGNIALYQVGRKLSQISKENYTAINRDFIDDLPYFKVRKANLLGYYNPYGKQILSCKYQKIDSHIESSDNPSLKDASLILKQNGKYGLYNIHFKKMILNCAYDSIYINSDVINVKNENAWGLIDYQYVRDHGKIVWKIEPKYDSPLEWHKTEHYIDFGSGQSRGRMDENEKVLIEARYGRFEYLRSLSEPKEQVFIKTILNENTYGIYLQGEKELLPCKYDYVGLPKSTVHPVAIVGQKVNGNMQYGIYNLEKQNFIAECKYEFIEQARDQFLFMVGNQNDYGILDSLGNKVPNFKFKSIKGKAKDVFDAYYMKPQYYLVEGEDGMGLFNSEDLCLSIPMEYDSIQYYDFPFLLVWKNGLTGLYQVREKELVIPVEFNSIQNLNLITILEKNGQYEFRNREDSVIISNALDFEDFNDYLKIEKQGTIEIYKNEYPTYTFFCKLDAEEVLQHFEFYRFKRDGKYGLLDENFKEIIKPEYDLVHVFKNNIIIVGLKNPWATLDHNYTVGLLDKTGKEILPIEYKYSKEAGNFFFLKEGKKYFLNDNLELEEAME